MKKILPHNAEGEYDVETIEVIYYYEKIPDVETGDMNVILVAGILFILASITDFFDGKIAYKGRQCYNILLYVKEI